MKSKNYILLVLATGLMTGSMVSCSDFLDTKPSTSVDDTDVFQTTSGAQSALNGCYYQMRAYGSGGANRGDDYGIPSIQMISDMCGEDVMNNGSGWYLYNYNYANYMSSYTSKFIFNNSFARLRNVTLGYTLPKNFTKKFQVNSLRLFVQGDNLVTIGSAARRGTDPEQSISGTTANRFPVTKSVSFGLQLNL